MPNVLLFREPSKGEDRYESLLTAAGYTAKSIPVLETVHVNTDELARRLLEEYTTYSGVVITSKRSCEALHDALNSIEDIDALSRALATWSTLPFYVVGEGTSSAIRRVQSAYQTRGFTQVLTAGEPSGTGEQLGHFIVKHHATGSKALLYLTGDKNRDTVPTILGKSHVAFQSLQVYETRGRSDFESLLEQSLALDDRPQWVVHFAPSSTAFVVPILERHPPLPSARVAAIGPVTSNFIHDKLHLEVHAVASSPSPEELVDAIVQYDRKR